MDKKTRNKIRKIQASVGKDPIKKIYKYVDDRKHEKELLEMAMKNRSLPLKAREEAKKLLHNLQKDKKVSLRIDEKEAAKLDREMEGRIEAAIKKGQIPRYDPKNDHQAKKWLKEL